MLLQLKGNHYKLQQNPYSAGFIDDPDCKKDINEPIDNIITKSQKMKKLTLLLLSVLVVGTYVTHAQDKKSGDKVGGIRFGAHAATMVKDGSSPDTSNYLNSFYVGFFRDSKIAAILYFGSGLEYFQNGLDYSTNSKRVLHTISIPLDLKVKLGPVFALGGIAANFKVSEKLVY